MPKFDTNTPRIPVVVHGIELQAPALFKEGDALPSSIAKYLNQQIATDVAKPLPSRLKAGTLKLKDSKGADLPVPGENEAASDEFKSALQAAYDERFGAFEPGESNRIGVVTVDPVTKLAREFAEPKVTEILTKQGYKVADAKKVKQDNGRTLWSNLIDQFVEANPWTRTLAQQQIDAYNAAAAQAAGEFDLSALKAQPAASTEPGEAGDSTEAGDGSDTLTGGEVEPDVVADPESVADLQNGGGTE
jgi:hypothetical protein